jgi:hypothetical protein
MAYIFPGISSGTMRVYGALASQAMAMYPATLSHRFITRVLKFVNDSEQRWTVSGELFSCVLEFSHLSGYDFAQILGFFQTMRGAYIDAALLNTFSITIDSVPYYWCVFDQDSIQDETGVDESHAFKLAIKQLRPN